MIVFLINGVGVKEPAVITEEITSYYQMLYKERGFGGLNLILENNLLSVMKIILLSKVNFKNRR